MADKKKTKNKKQWVCECGQENGKGFNLCQKCLEVKPIFNK